VKDFIPLALPFIPGLGCFGEFIKDQRQSIVLGPKYNNAMPGNDPNAWAMITRA
jgi:hypothetical protein